LSYEQIGQGDPARFQIRTDGTSWHVFGDSRDIIFATPDAALTYALGQINDFDKITGKGNGTFAATVTITKYVRLEWYGKITVGNFAAFTLNIPQNTEFVELGGNAVYGMSYIDVTVIQGPAQYGVGNTSSAGIKALFYSQQHIRVGQIIDCFYGLWQAWNSGGNFADNWVDIQVTFCNTAIYVQGGSPRMSGEGNNYDVKIFGCQKGLVADSNADFAFNVFRGTIDNAFVPGTNWVNNNAIIVGTAIPTVNIILLDFLRIGGSEVFQAGDIGFTIASSGYGTQSGVSARALMTTRLQVHQKQIAVAFSAATSIAVTFPEAEQDTNYSVFVEFQQNSGAYWITGKSTTGCTINWVTSSTGSLDYFVQR
jgi:hypothetical protein